MTISVAADTAGGGGGGAGGGGEIFGARVAARSSVRGSLHPRRGVILSGPCAAHKFDERVMSSGKTRLYMKPQFQPRLVGHHVHAPGRIPCQLDIDGAFTPSERFDRIGDPARQSRPPRGQPGGGQRQ